MEDKLLGVKMKSRDQKKLTIIGEQEEELRCEDSRSCNDNDYFNNNGNHAINHEEVKYVLPAGAGELGMPLPDESANEQESPDQNKEVNKRFKRQKSKHIKKILKERLNIDCLRMLGEEDPEPAEAGDAAANIGNNENSGVNKGPTNIQSSMNLNDSYHVLMREIGIENNDGLTQAFLEKNGKPQREELNSFTEMFSVRDLLGVGAFGVVLLVKNRQTKEKSALKIIAKERLSERSQKILKNESTIMQSMNHPAVVSLKRIFENQKFIILEMELIPGGQLKRLYKLKDDKGKPKQLSDLEASSVMRSLLTGVAYVHARDIIHRDLKPENILLTDQRDDCRDVKIVDFGLSAEQNWRLHHNERAGTPIYMAPEQVTKKGYSKKVDLWACGIIAFQLLTCGSHPCWQPGEQNYYKKLENIESNPIVWNFPTNFTPLAKDFFLNLCAYPPSLRYDAATALQHPWITRNANDEIPLNQQQEFAMFQCEHQLRKVMRLAYLTSLVKMHHFQTQNGGASDDSTDADQENNRKQQDSQSETFSQQITMASRDQSQQRQQATEVLSRKKPITKFSTDRPGRLNLPQEAVRIDSMRTSAKPLHKMAHSGAISTTNSHTKNDKNNNGVKYKHEAFLQPSVFSSYKELLAVQSAHHKQSTDSTSAESPNRYLSSEEKVGGHISRSDHSLEVEEISKKFGGKNINATSAPKRTKARKNKQAKQPALSPKAGVDMATANGNFSNQPTSNLLAAAQDLEQQENMRRLASNSFSQTQTAYNCMPATGTGSAAKRLSKQGSTFSNRDEDIIAGASSTQTAQFNYGGLNRPGRNLVPVRSPLGTAQNKISSDYEQVCGEAPSVMTSTNYGKTSNKAAKQGLVASNSIDTDGGASSKVDPRSGIEIKRKSNATNYPIVKELLKAPALKEPLSANLPRKFQQACTLEMLKNDDQQSDSSSKLIRKNMSPRQKLNGSAIVKKKGEKKKGGAPFLNDDGDYDLTIRRQINSELTEQDIEPLKEYNHMIDPNNGHQSNAQSRKNGANSSSTKKGTFKSGGGLVGPDNFTLAHSDAQNVLASKSSKKRAPKKSRANGNDISNQRSLHTQATFEVQSTKLTFMSGPRDYNKMQSGIDTKIDWLQMAKEEKTMAGSKILQEQLNKAQPAYMLNGEQLRSSRALTLNQDVRKHSQPMIYQAPITTDHLNAKSQQKSLKGSRKLTKSPYYQMKQTNNAQAAMNPNNIQKQKSFGTEKKNAPWHDTEQNGPMHQHGSFVIGNDNEYKAIFASPDVKQRGMPLEMKQSKQSKTSTKKLSFTEDQQVVGAGLRNCMSSTSTEDIANQMRNLSIVNQQRSALPMTADNDDNVELRKNSLSLNYNSANKRSDMIGQQIAVMNAVLSNNTAVLVKAIPEPPAQYLVVQTRNSGGAAAAANHDSYTMHHNNWQGAGRNIIDTQLRLEIANSRPQQDHQNLQIRNQKYRSSTESKLADMAAEQKIGMKGQAPHAMLRTSQEFLQQAYSQVAAQLEPTGRPKSKQAAMQITSQDKLHRKTNNNHHH